MEKYTIEASGKKITNLSAEDVVKHYQNKVTTELIGSLASTEYPETFADAEEVAQDFGDTVTKVEPTKDNAKEGGKAKFADGDESAQNFNGCPDCDKMLSKASKNEFVAATPNDYKKFKRFVKRNEWSFPYVEKDDITLLVKPHSDKYNYTLYAFQIKDDKSFGIAGEDNKYHDGFLESRGAHSLKDVFRDINEWWNDNDPELSHFLEEYPDFQEVSESDFNTISSNLVEETSAKGTKMQVYFDVKAEDYHDMDANLDELLNILESITKRKDIIVREEDDVVDNEELTHFTVEFEVYPDAAPDVIVPTLDEFEEALEFFGAEEIGELELNNSKCETSAEKEEVVVIDLDGKVLSWVDDEHVDFLDTVDEPDGGKAKAVKFEDEIDVRDTMERVDIPEDEYEILPVSKAFAFVEEGEE